METSFSLHNEYWSWDFYTQGEDLKATIRTNTLKLPAPAEDVALCGVSGQSITLVDTLDEQSVRVVWSDDAILSLMLADDTLEWQFASGTSAVSFPYWAGLYTQASADVTIRTDRQFLDANGHAIPRHAAQSLPAACIGKDETTLTLIVDAPAWFEDVVTENAGKSFGGSFALHAGGWRESFARYRTRLRGRVNLSEYEREDLDWYKNQWVQHFTFLYGREILNLKTHQFEPERFLDDAERDFGGYDGILYWASYPRMGIDERNQWDFFDDMPGGRTRLREISDLAHERGIRVFVPYKPWDRSDVLHGAANGSANADELARLISDLDADGVFLDTMSAIDPSFRTTIDAAKPGVVLCSELHVKPEAFEVITGSWDQSYTRNGMEGNSSAEIERMPGIDPMRFVFPEHRLFVINRHAVGDDRLLVTMRGFFGGTGWVVWQDIFGLTLPYAPDEAALLKKCRTIFREHETAMNTDTPTPLLPTLVDGVYCNEFAAPEERLWTFYNDTDAPIDAAVLRIEQRAGTRLVDAWNGGAADVENGALRVKLAAKSVGCVVEVPDDGSAATEYP